MSPSPDSSKQRIVEKSAFEDDDDEESEEEDTIQPYSSGGASGTSADGVKRTLSDTIEESKVQEAVLKATAAAQ